MGAAICPQPEDRPLISSSTKVKPNPAPMLRHPDNPRGIATPCRSKTLSYFVAFFSAAFLSAAFLSSASRALSLQICRYA